ncbi:hypothetical protein GCM10010442_46720 [Kitasatospora kifunensis]
MPRPVVVTGEVADALVVRVLNLDMGYPLGKEGRLSKGTPEIEGGGGPAGFEPARRSASPEK